MHTAEEDSLLKYAYKLSGKALNPSNLEQLNVTYVLQVFNKFVAQALLALGTKFNIPNFEDTSTYINIFTTWWSIVNVKTPMKGQRLRNVYEQPLVANDTISKKFLNYLLDWLTNWHAMEGATGKLTKETFTALQHTTHALLEVADYCITQLGARYVLLCKFQTDCVEARFGQYRQLCGRKYDVSLRQIFEVRKKIRIMSVLKLSLNNKCFVLESFKFDWSEFECCSKFDDVDIGPVTADNLKKANDYLPVITYIAGYCVYSVTKKLKCDKCREVLISPGGNVENLSNTLIASVSRGGLLYPSESVISLVLITYLVINKLCCNAEFQMSFHQRNVAVHTAMSVAYNEELCLLQLNPCNNSHSYFDVAKMIVWVSANCMLNNFCSLKNDQLNINKKSRKRKLATLNTSQC